MTGKKRPSTLKFSNIPWTGWPLIRKEILGTLRSRQQLTTSSAARMCWLGEATWRGTWPTQRNDGYVTLTHHCIYRINKITTFTWPQVKAIKAIRVEVIAHTIATPALSSSWVRTEALSQSPANTQMASLGCHKWLHIVHHHLKVPLLILCGTFTSPQKDIGPHATRRKWHSCSKRIIIFSISLM